jgi:hypothetical protein
MHRLFVALAIVTLAACTDFQAERATTSPAAAQASASSSTDPLPSWNEGVSKKAIRDFVSRVTREGTQDFVPAAGRIATFDNDGTLWSEQPIYRSRR